MTDRLLKIFDALPCCDTFADIGCDHGYISLMMLKSAKCGKVLFSDVSEKSLSKAQKLLKNYVAQGKAFGFVSDGFDNLPECDLALISGMGGEEIINILKRRKNLPLRLVLQPMKNLPKVRKFVVDSGYKIQKDYIFYSQEKFYNIMVLEKGNDRLTDKEIEFGRTNISEFPQDFTRYLHSEISKIDGYLSAENITEKAKTDLQNKKKELMFYVENK